MRRNLNSRSRQTGKRVVNSHITSSREDRATMADACFWLASTESAEFLCLNVWTHHLLGRGREASFSKADDIRSVDTDDQEIECEVLGVNIQRDQTGLVQDLNLYPHKHAIQHDPCFALIYRILVQGFQNELFPMFRKLLR